MDDETIDKINETLRAAIEESIAKLPTPGDETVILTNADGRRVELHSAKESIDSLLSKATKQLTALKENNGKTPVAYTQ